MQMAMVFHSRLPIAESPADRRRAPHVPIIIIVTNGKILSILMLK